MPNAKSLSLPIMASPYRYILQRYSGPASRYVLTPGLKSCQNARIRITSKGRTSATTRQWHLAVGSTIWGHANESACRNLAEAFDLDRQVRQRGKACEPRAVKGRITRGLRHYRDDRSQVARTQPPYMQIV